MRISIGKIDESPNKIHSFRVPISSVEFQPGVPNDEQTTAGAIHKLLVAGGSSVAIWVLKIIPEKPRDLNNTDYSRTGKDQKDDDTSNLNKLEESNISRWLHANASQPRISTETVFSATDHAPAYVLRARWSPDGSKFASADGSQIFLWAAKKHQPDMWTRSTTILEPIVGEIFDFDWITPSILAIGGIGIVTLRSIIGPQRVANIKLQEGAICKGVSTRSVSDDVALVGIATNLQEIFIYEIDFTKEHPILLFHNNELFQEGPLDVPLLRHCSIDPSGRSVSFSYGERGADSFGTIFNVDDIRQALKLKNSIADETEADSRSQELLKDCQFRIRGHQARVNVIAFGRCQRALNISPLSFLRNPASCDEDTELFVEKFQQAIENAMNSNMWPSYVRYAQASVDGCLSVWDIYRSQNGNSLSGQCLIATPNSIVDQTGLVTDLSWSANDDMLAVASDDGKLTVLLFEDETKQPPISFADMQYICPNTTMTLKSSDSVSHLKPE